MMNICTAFLSILKDPAYYVKVKCYRADYITLNLKRNLTYGMMDFLENQSGISFPHNNHSRVLLIGNSN